MAEPFSMKLSAARKKAGLTQKELSNKTGLSLSSIKRYENGEREPSFSTIENIALSLGINALDLVHTITMDDFECGKTVIEVTVPDPTERFNNQKQYDSYHRNLHKLLNEAATLEPSQPPDALRFVDYLKSTYQPPQE